MFFAAYMYDSAGTPVWYAATLKANGSNSYSGSLMQYSGGQTLGGSFHAPSGSAPVGSVQLAFTSRTTANLLITGSGLEPTNAAIQRYAIVPNGLSSPPTAAQPQTGWWWNPAEAGRGYFLEVQNGAVFFAGYMYDVSGKAIWYAAQSGLTSDSSFSGTLVQYGNGQILGGSYKTASVVNSNVGAVSLQFSSPSVGTLVLPNGTQIPIQRYTF